MMAFKRKLLSSNAGISDKEHRWVNFRKQAKGIKPSPLTSWVDTNEVPGEEGATAHVDWKDLISSDVDPNWTPKIQDPVHFQVDTLHHNIRAWEDVLESPPLAERINSCLWDKVDILWYSVNRLQACISVTDIPQSCSNYITETLPHLFAKQLVSL